MAKFKNLEGYEKIKEDYRYSIETVWFYNIKTKEIKSINVDDREYTYGDEMGLIDRNYDISERYEMKQMPINKEYLKQYNIENNIPFVGAKIEVIKGRKYKKGMQGTIIKQYDYNDKYGRLVAHYCITDNGMKINESNVKVIG